MTEAEWLACTDPESMLKFLQGKVSDRKLRWFAVACCRRISHLILDPRSQPAVEAAEHLAEGLVADDDVWPTRDEADLAGADSERGDGCQDSREAAFQMMDPDAFFAADAASFCAAHAVGGRTGDEAEKTARQAEQAAQADLLRDIFGTLAFRGVSLDPSLLVWNGGTVVKLAQGIYDDRAFDRLPVLADALEEAGCTDVDILGHCRQPGPHVRGCWCVDLLLAKS